ncbi:MAG TPA: hypothetical protein VGF65_06540 [Mycobacterium sp.]
MVTTAEVEQALQIAGWALLRLPHTGPSTNLAMSHWLVVHDAAEAYGYNEVETRRPVPTPGEVTMLDLASQWLSFISDIRTRRVVALRLLYDDDKGRHVLSYRRIADMLHCSHTHTKDLWETGVARIARQLNRTQYSFVQPRREFRFANLAQIRQLAS